MKKFLLLRVLQFPQMLLGTILIKILHAEKRIFITKAGKQIVWWRFERRTQFERFFSGGSFAAIILLSDDNSSEVTICHEYGHSIQSLYLGWLYLPIIGVYSAVLCNLWDRLFHKGWCRYDRHYWYYKIRWTEKWADDLGGVDRDSVLLRISRPENARYPKTA